MANGQIYQGDIGTVFLIDTKSNISTGTVFQLKIKKPSGTEVIWTGELSGTTKVQYTTVAGDLNESGLYKLQVYVEIPSWRGRGKTAEFTVYKAFA